MLAGTVGALGLAALALLWPAPERDSVAGPEGQAAAERVSLATQLAAPEVEAALPAPSPALDAPVHPVATRTEQPPASLPALEEEPPASGELVVQVVSRETGEPQAGEGVRVVELARPTSHGTWRVPGGSRGGPWDLLLSDADGRVTFELAAGVAWRVRHDALDEPSQGLPVDPLLPGESREVLLAIPTAPDLVCFVRVVNAADGLPLAGAEVVLEEGGMHGEPRRTSFLADAEGLVELPSRSWAYPNGEVLLAGYGPLRFRPEDGRESPEEALVLPLLRTASLRGKVAAAAGELAGLTVELRTDLEELELDQPMFLSGGDDPTWGATTGDGGAFQLDDLPAGVPLAVEVRRGVHVLHKERDPLVLEPGEAREVLWRIGVGCTLRGTVVDQHGEPVPRAVIRLLPGEVEDCYEELDDAHALTVADAEGRFAFEALQPGTWSVGPDLPSYDAPSDALAPIALVLELGPAETEREIRLEAFRGIYVRGRVLDPGGDPVLAGGWVYGWTTRGVAGDDVEEEDRGAFVLGPLAPGPVHVRASFEGFSSDLVEVLAGEEGIELRLEPGGVLAGTVVDAQTGLPADAEVTAFDGEVEFGMFGWSPAEGGAFSIHGLPVGTCDVIATTADDRIGVLAGVSLGEGADVRGLTILVSPGALLSVRGEGGQRSFFTVRSGGARVAEAWVGDHRRPGGLLVPPGTLLVEVFEEDPEDPEGSWTKSTERTVTLSAGERRELVLGKDE